MNPIYIKTMEEVSTHSRLKAAGAAERRPLCRLCRFNTQPPEGGWAAETAANAG